MAEVGTEGTTPSVGALLGKYRVEGVVGKGGMGVILGARHEVLGHRVAIKLLSTKARANPTVLARFLREARATMELKSEHVVRMLDEGTTEDGSAYLVMEYLEGEDLLHVLAGKGPLPVDQAVEHILQACDAMAEAHAHGIVHRDLKPANLFLTRRADGRKLIKVLDFGISKLTVDTTDNELTDTLAMLGSPTYMSPEQIRSAKTVDGRTDVWSLGVVLFRLLTQATPFVGEGAIAMCTAILNDAPKPPRELRPELPPALEAIILRCLEKDPSRRFADMNELGRALAPFAPDGVTAARFRGAFAPVSDEPSVVAPILDLSKLSDPGTQAAVVTHSGVAPRAPRRWLAPAFGAIALLAVGGALFLRNSGSTPSPASSTPSPSPVVSAAPTPTPTPSAPPKPTISASASASAAPSIFQPKPVAKPAPKPKTATTWGGAIDDPL